MVLFAAGLYIGNWTSAHHSSLSDLSSSDAGNSYWPRNALMIRLRSADKDLRRKGTLVIQLTRLNGNPIALNSDLIKFVENAPDTVITLN